MSNSVAPHTDDTSGLTGRPSIGNPFTRVEPSSERNLAYDRGNETSRSASTS